MVRAVSIPNPYDVATAAIVTYGALQKPGELAGLLEMVDMLFPAPGPRVIVEIGSDAGGTLFAWQACYPNAARLSVTLVGGPFADVGGDRNARRRPDRIRFARLAYARARARDLSGGRCSVR